MRRGESGINCLLAVRKPVGMTSHDVVGRVRRALGERRVGHAGTLDPDASGVLVVGVGQGTRLMGMLTMDNKSYRATIEFGSETTTDDAEGEVTVTAAVPAELAQADHAAQVVAGLVGEVDQVPPAYSAISVDGRRAYDRARAGEKVELPARRITINAATLVAVNVPEDGGPLTWVCDFDVSKGTYIRSIARDLGRSVGSAAHLVALERTSSGSVGIDSCVELDELLELGPAALERYALDPARALGHKVLQLDDALLEDVLCGKRIAAPRELGLAGDERVTLVHEGKVVGVWHRMGSRLACDANFPAGISGVRA